MKYKVSYSKWLMLLLVLLILCVANSGAIRFPRQVIALLGTDSIVHNAGYSLYTKNRGITQVVTPTPDTNKIKYEGTDVIGFNPKTMQFQRMKWDDHANKFVHDPYADKLPVDWDNVRLHAIGHGGMGKIGNLYPQGLATAFNVLTKNQKAGHYSIGACGVDGENSLENYLKTFLETLGHAETTVSYRRGLVAIDQQGRTLTGTYVRDEENNQIGVAWAHKDSSAKVVGELIGGNAHIRQALATDEPALAPHYFGILPNDAPIYIGSKVDSEMFKISDQDIFTWVDRRARDLYMEIGTRFKGERSSLKMHKVHLLENPDQEPVDLSVREINGYDDLLKELYHHGENGPTKSNNKEYFRFGDWVLSMRPDTFYVDVEGIIATSQNVEEINQYKDNGWTKVPPDYANMREGITNNFKSEDKFIEEVHHWINGRHDLIGLGRESAYHAQCGMAMFMAESIRSFHSHITNMKSLQLIDEGYMNVDLLFNTHPMARGGTWQIKNQEGEKKTGLKLLEPDQLAYNALSFSNRKTYDGITKRISKISKTWLSHVDTRHVTGAWTTETSTAFDSVTNADHVQNLLGSVEDIGQESPLSQRYLRPFELSQSGPLLSGSLIAPQVEAVENQIDGQSKTENLASPVQASQSLDNDQVYISDLISKQVELREQQTGKQYEILPDSITVGDRENSIKFQVHDKSNPTEMEEITVTIDEDEMSSTSFLDDLQGKADEINEHTDGSFQETTSRINHGLAIYGVARGLLGSIGALEDGNVEQGAIGLAQSLHGTGELSGVNRAIYKQSGKVLGKLFRKDIQNIDVSVSTINGESAEKLLLTAEGDALSTVGRVGDLMEDIPIIGTAFGIYNIYEDFQQHSAIGYIDGGLDIAITGLGFLGPETEPVVLALTVVRMTIDTFYADISKELQNLPSGASVGQKIGAVFRGILNAGEDLYKEFTLNGQIVGAFENSKKLDRQHERDEEYLKMVSDYHNYFHVVMETGSNTGEINFAGGSQSLNGGSITFHLGEFGISTFSLRTVNEHGAPVYETHHINTNNIEDIVMGIGESEIVNFKNEKVKVLFLIPVHSQRVISGISHFRDSLHGTYYGNSQNNKFVAVQQLPPNTNLGYELTDYYYRLFGMAGDDSFYLGPQHSYVEGNDGSDVYFINEEAVHTEINNYADDGKDDFVIFQINYDQFTAVREGLDLYFFSMNGGTHNIKVCNWFHSEAYQHIVFKTKDGVLFKISATNMGGVKRVPHGLSGDMATSRVVYDTREDKYSQVVSIAGSPFNDIIFGNNMGQNIDGGKGQDSIQGGNGKDTYSFNVNEGVDVIDNYATDGIVDTVMLPMEFDDADLSMEGEHLRVMKKDNPVTGAIITHWFRDEKYRHMIFVTQDGVVSNVSSQSAKFHPIFVDMSLITPVAPGEHHTAIINKVNFCGNNPRYTIWLQCQTDLSLDPLLVNVVSIFGSDHNDYIVGNDKHNYISAGKGNDYLEGKNGKDVYVIHEGDGFVVINNYAEDDIVDTILFGAKCDDIQISLECSTLVLTAYESDPHKVIKVLITDWFSPCNQHLLVRSIDGVVFELPTNPFGSLSTTAKTIDYSTLTSGAEITLTGKFSQVERVVGSNGGRDVIIGNSLNNYIDPAPENGYLQGNNGSDTYVIEPNYGKGNIIYNYATDHTPDTLRFPVPYFSIDSRIQGRDIQLKSNTTEGCVNIKLKDYYADNKTHHLTVLTNDGISFVIPPSHNFKPVPILINRATTTTGQHINLTAIPDYAEVRTVRGSNGHQNFIIGNSQDNTIVGGSEPDGLYGLDGDDIVKGGGGDDMLFGGSGDDTLVGGSGDDQLNGGEGDDVISPGLGRNTVNGGSGSDTVIYGGDVLERRGIHLDLPNSICMHERDAQDTLTHIENAYGTIYDDVLEGNDDDNILIGQGGDDTLIPGSGYDILNGGNGTDTYDLSAANGTVIIQNYAKDGILDRVIMTYAKMSSLFYVKNNNDLIIQATNIQYPYFIDASKPNVVVKDWYVCQQLYQHLYVDAEDGRIATNTVYQHAKEAADRAA